MPRSEIDLLKKIYISRHGGIHGNVINKKFLIDYIYNVPLQRILSNSKNKHCI